MDWVEKMQWGRMKLSSNLWAPYYPFCYEAFEQKVDEMLLYMLSYNKLFVIGRIGM